MGNRFDKPYKKPPAAKADTPAKPRPGPSAGGPRPESRPVLADKAAYGGFKSGFKSSAAPEAPAAAERPSRPTGPGTGPPVRKPFVSKRVAPPHVGTFPTPHFGDPNRDGKIRRRPAPRLGKQPTLRVIFEDADFILVDKPCGIVTANLEPSGNSRISLLDLVKEHIKTTGTGTSRRQQREKMLDDEFETGRKSKRIPPVGVIHRLDLEASGIVVFSKTDVAFQSLKAELKAKRTHRMYFAVLEGELAKPGDPNAQGTIQSMMREAESGLVYSIKSDQFKGRKELPGQGPTDSGDDDAGFIARPAVTHFNVLAVANGRTLVQLRLETGRKHQIRVHMAERGFPIVGDFKYGARTDPLKRLGLHAAELGFVHPVTKRSERWYSPVPISFYKALNLDAPPTSIREQAHREGDTGDDASPTHAPTASPAALPVKGKAKSSVAPAASTSWDEVSDWYDQLQSGKRNDHYHATIIPAVLRLLDPKPGERILDIACGQGVIATELVRQGCNVVGIDAAPGLIEAAKKHAAALLKAHPATPDKPSDKPSDKPADKPVGKSALLVGDATRLGDTLEKAKQLGKPFDKALCVMALGNIERIEPLFADLSRALRPGGQFVLVISHPAFRVHGHSSWSFDDSAEDGRAVQSRRIDSYMTPTRREIAMHPGDAPDVITMSFHRPISAYINALAKAGLLVEATDELIGQRQSEPGPRAEAENRARREIPLFLALRAVKQ